MNVHLCFWASCAVLSFFYIYEQLCLQMTFKNTAIVRWKQGLLVWFGFLRIYVDLAIFQSYLDIEAGDNQSLKIQVARPGIEPRSSCSASQELDHSATAAPRACLYSLGNTHANNNYSITDSIVFIKRDKHVQTVYKAILISCFAIGNIKRAMNLWKLEIQGNCHKQTMALGKCASNINSFDSKVIVTIQQFLSICNYATTTADIFCPNKFIVQSDKLLGHHSYDIHISQYIYLSVFVLISQIEWLDEPHPRYTDSCQEHQETLELLL